MSYTPPLDAEVTAFVTTALLASGATFNSGVLDADGKTQVQTEINASHDGTIDISFCADSGCTDVVRSLSIPYTAADGYQFFAAPAFGNFIEYKFTNTTAATQTDFYYTTKFLTTGLSPQLLTTEAFIAPAMVSSLNRSISVGENINGIYHNAHHGGISTTNSTTTPLSGTGVYEGGFVKTIGMTSTSIFVKSDVDSAVGGLKVIHSSDGITDDRVLGFTFIAADNPQGLIYLIPASTQYFRLKYVNGVSAQTEFITSIKFESSPQQLPTLPINLPISDNTLANTVKALSVGQQPDGTYHNELHDGVAFQTTDDLVTGATFSSDVIDAQGYTQVQTHIVSDQDGTLGFKFCSTSDCSGTTVGADGVERYLSVPYVADNGFQLYAAPAFTPYVQYTFENTGTGTTTQLFYETKLLTKALSGQLLGLDAFIAPAMVANLGRNIIAGAVGSTFKNVNVAETTNDAGTYHNLHVVSGARPSQLPGRTPVKIVLDISNTPTLVYSATTGKTLYITDLVIFIENSNETEAGRVNLVNSTGATTPVVYPMVLADAGNKSTASLVNSHTFTEPLEFDTGVYVDTVDGTNEIVGILNGYEE